MLKKVFLFPETKCLCEKWWHRLATVVFYFWLFSIVIFTVKVLILEPYSSCIATKYYNLSKPADLDCGSSAYNYAYSTYSSEPLANILSSAALIFIAMFVAAILPSLLYRILLFIGKGATWKDSSNVT